jgi:predicted metal-dependent peptidase
MNLKHIPLEATQKQQWSDTMSLMAWSAPGFRHLFYRLLCNHGGEYAAVMSDFTYGDILGNGDKTPGVAFTDGEDIVCNPGTFFKYSLKERVFILGHEVAHNVYDDPGLMWRLRNETHITCTDGKVFPYKPEVMQHAMDYRINAMLVDSRIGNMPADCLYDPKIAEAKEGVLDIYGKVYKQDDEGGAGGPSKGPGHGNEQGNNGFDPNGVLPPGAGSGKQPGQAAQQRNTQQWSVECAQASALERQRARGKTPGSMQHMFDNILDPKVPWIDYIDAICKRVMGGGSYNWKKPDRRFIGRDLWLPGRGGSGAGWLVIWGDTSGSIGENDLNRYLGEMKGLIEEMSPERLTVIWCDAKIHHVDEVDDVEDLERVKARGVGGRGGTNIAPVMDWIAECRDRQPDMFIGMTDGQFPFPEKPAFPIIWASIHDNKSQYPYGEVVPINS